MLLQESKIGINTDDIPKYARKRKIISFVVIEAIENYNANILMMSSLLTTTMSEMKKVMDMLEDRKLRQSVHVFIGGASVGESFREKIGADCYTESVVDLLDYLKKNMARIKENS